MRETGGREGGVALAGSWPGDPRPSIPIALATPGDDGGVIASIPITPLGLGLFAFRVAILRLPSRSAACRVRTASPGASTAGTLSM
jgi:hypothetical protein